MSWHALLFLHGHQGKCSLAGNRGLLQGDLHLETRTDEPVSTNALAERLELTSGSVSGMLKKLDELGLISHVPYRGVRLTPEGRRVALEVIRHHRLLELYLAEALQMPWDRVHDEAEVLEHVLSEELEALIAAKLGNPTIDPHGDPIPSADLELEESPTRSLESLVRASRAHSCAYPMPTLRCCVTWPNRECCPGATSRCSSASRSAVRYSSASTGASTRSAERCRERCASSVDPWLGGSA